MSWAMVRVSVDVENETDDAWLLSDNYGTEEWVPKSLVRDQNDGTFLMPAWLVEEKGFS